MDRYRIKRIKAGFTLVELMVVLVIIGILASISLPAYRGYVTKALRSEARQVLTDIAIKQERFFSNCGFYAGAIDTTTSVCGLTTPTIRADATSPSGEYAISVIYSGPPGAENSAYTITAVATDDDECARLTLDSQGVRMGLGANSVVNNPECWE